jgi:hypothetical protein
MPDPTHNGELKMRKLLTATALVATLFSGSAFAKDDLVDYSDKSVTTCDKDEIEEKMTALAENGRAGKMGVNLLYLKGEPVETSRKTDELLCRVTAVYSIGTVKGVFYYKTDEGHSLVGFKPGMSK